jgi:uncharacterized glyoxalase superfamily protein PhnB
LDTPKQHCRLLNVSVKLGEPQGDRINSNVVLYQAVSAGARLIKPAMEVFWGGYSGYFQDTEGHSWEVAYNPHQDLT